MEKKDYNLSEQLDHIAYMFNVRTYGKAYENFIVNAIYTKVGNPNLVPITQQYVKNLKDKRKYYLLDLYFPQLNYGIEIDERHHKDQQQKDEIRADDIKSAIQCEEGRIPIYTNDEKRSYFEICKDIEREVKIIQKKILEKGGVQWETNKDRKEKIIRLGRFHVDDNVSFDTITEIYNICGGKRTGQDKGKDAEKLQRCYYRLTDKYKLWVPTLAIQFGSTTKGKNGYKNFLSEDHELITENTDTPWKDPDKDNHYKRVVFMRMKDRFGKSCIKFIGIFESTNGLGDKHWVRYYKRIASEITFDVLRRF